MTTEHKPHSRPRWLVQFHPDDRAVTVPEAQRLVDDTFNVDEFEFPIEVEIEWNEGVEPGEALITDRLVRSAVRG